MKLPLKFRGYIFDCSKHYNVPAPVIASVIMIESSFNENVSPRFEKHLNDSSYGLMQILYKTAKDLGFKSEPNQLEEPKIGIRYGVKYLSNIFSKYSEIPENFERWKFTLAAYNAGRGSINKTLALAREKNNLPKSYEDWINHGSQSGQWQTWDFCKDILPEVTGWRSKYTLRYIEKFTSYYNFYKKELKKDMEYFVEQIKMLLAVNGLNLNRSSKLKELCELGRDLVII